MIRLSCFLLLAICFVSCSNRVNENLKYLAQEMPASVAEIFAPKLISSTDKYEFGSVFNTDGTECYYGINVDGRAEIRFTKLEGNSWSAPKTIVSHKRYSHNDPFLSPDEKRLYFISDRPLDGVGATKDYDIWYVEKADNGWSDPINAGTNINTAANEYYISFTKDGAMYFSSNKRENNFDIYTSKVVDGKFQEAVPMSDAVNTAHYEADVFVDPNERYVIFCAERPDGLGRGDLYVSFKQEDGSWSPAQNMGAVINTEHHELCPFVSKDGKYFFYTSNKDIYWVNAKMIEGLRGNEP